MIIQTEWARPLQDSSRQHLGYVSHLFHHLIIASSPIGITKPTICRLARHGGVKC
jgi:hypothetical protein